MAQDFEETTVPPPTTTTTMVPIILQQLAGAGVAIGHRSMSVRAISSSDNLPEFFFNVEDEKEIREKFEPFTPQLRPWLVIVEVNMTDEKLNTECTGTLAKSNMKNKK